MFIPTTDNNSLHETRNDGVMDELEALKHLLGGAQQQKEIEKITHRVSDPKKRNADVANILPTALFSANKKQGGALRTALQNPVTDCVEQAMLKQPQRFVKPILSVMSNAIRSHLADTFKAIRGFLQQQQGQLDQHSRQVNELQQRIKQLEALQETGQRQCTLLQQHLDNFEKDSKDSQKRMREVAALLPDAVYHASKDNGGNNQLAEALKRPIEGAIKESIKNDTKSMANALFPIMGPAIRQSINSSIKEMAQQFNQTMDESFSLRGMRWRYEAMRSGSSFAEVVLQKTLVYRIEQVFFIHRETGILMQHLHQEDNETNTDADAVSGMLTAIQDFIRDSFSTGDEELNSVEIGKYTVWLERGPYAVLACVIRGSAPMEFRTQMREVQEILHQRYSSILEEFEGDSDETEPCLPILQKTLQSETQEPIKGGSVSFIKKMVLLGVLLIVIFTALYYKFQSWLTERYIQAYITELDNTPGIIINRYLWQDDVLTIQGFRDELATSTQQIAEQMDLHVTIETKWNIYQDMSSYFVKQRLRKTLDNYPTPATAQLELDNKRVILQGYAEREWINKAAQSLILLNDVDSVDSSQIQVDIYQLKFDTYVKQLRNMAGIVVMDSGKRDGQYFVQGMRDSLTIDPQLLAQQQGLDQLQFQWQPYQDVSPKFVLQRAKAYLNPPDSIQMRLEQGEFFISGTANSTWLAQLQNFRITGIDTVNTEQLQNIDKVLLSHAREMLPNLSGVQLSVTDKALTIQGYISKTERQQLQQQVALLTGFADISQAQLQNQKVLRKSVIKRIEATAVYFAGETLLLPGQDQKLKQLTDDIKLLINLNRYLNKKRQVALTGHTDGIGNAASNVELSQKRANAIRNWLSQRGVVKTMLTIISPANLKADRTLMKLQHRKVTFKVVNK